MTGPGFGYPSGALGPLAGDWRTAFTGMLDAVLDDARHYGARLPRPADAVAYTLRAAHDAPDDCSRRRSPCAVAPARQRRVQGTVAPEFVAAPAEIEDLTS